jgi:hypothetical protein
MHFLEGESEAARRLGGETNEAIHGGHQVDWPRGVTLVTSCGTSGPFRNLAQPLSIALFRTGEPNEQHIDPGRTAGRIDRVL